LEESNEERKILAIRVNSLSSTTTFTLDTLSQHRALIIQLQDEVDFLRLQLISLQEQTSRRNEELGNLSSDAGSTEGEEAEAGILRPDMNVSVEVEEEREHPEKPPEASKK
jgi:hypothetical protein